MGFKSVELWFLLFNILQHTGLTDELDLSLTHHQSLNDIDPDFSEAIANVTVPLGREAVLSCSVTNLGTFKVGWLKAEDQTILTLHNKVITHNPRISVTHDNINTWQLHIRQVKETDRGCYMCQINTNTMKKQFGCLDVHVPPDITDEETSSDVTVREGENATLICRAKGRPPPRILWRREDGEHLEFRTNHREIVRVESSPGEVLNLTKLTRHQMGSYLCIASNDVPPAVSKRVTLNVNFAPLIKVPNQLLGAPLGTDVLLECLVEAYPNTINYWAKSHGEMLLNGRKHIIEQERNYYRIHLKLTVKNINKSDLGTYMCVSSNSLGKSEGTIRLYEIKMPTTISTTTTTITTTVHIPTTTYPATEVTTRRVTEKKTTTTALPVTIPVPLEPVREESSIGRSSTNYNENDIYFTNSCSTLKHFYVNFPLIALFIIILTRVHCYCMLC